MLRRSLSVRFQKITQPKLHSRTLLPREPPPPFGHHGLRVQEHRNGEGVVRIAVIPRLTSDLHIPKELRRAEQPFISRIRGRPPARLQRFTRQPAEFEGEE